MACVLTQEVCKGADETKPWGFNFALHFARKWAPNTPYANGVQIRPSAAFNQTGFGYTSNGGVSGANEPKKWSKILGGTVIDGSITWTAVIMTVDSLLERIDTVTWTVPAPLTIAEDPFVDTPAEQSTSGHFGGGVEGTTYDAEVSVLTTENNTYEAILKVEVE